MGFGVRCCGVDAYVCRVDTRVDAWATRSRRCGSGGPRYNPGLLARQSATFRNRICEMMQMHSLGPNYSAGGISSIATTLTAKHAVATRNVYPTISPNRSRTTARIGIAQNGWMRLVVPSP